MTTETTIKLYNVFNKLQYKYATLGSDVYSDVKVDLLDDKGKEVLQLRSAISLLIETYDQVEVNGEKYPFYGLISEHKVNQLLDKFIVFFELDPVPYLSFPNNSTNIRQEVVEQGQAGSGTSLPAGGGPNFFLTKDNAGNFVWRPIGSINSTIQGTRVQLLGRSKSEWQNDNTILRDREVGYEVEKSGNTILSVRSKVGNGVSPWNSLPYAGDDIYPYSDPTTEGFEGIPVNSNLEGRRVVDILRDLTSPYKKPSIQNFRIDGGSNIKLEVGRPLNASYGLTWAFDFESNVRNDNSGLLSATDVTAFQNLGNVNLRDKAFTLQSNSYKKNLPGSVSVRLNGQDIKGAALTQRSLNIEWLGRVRFGQLSKDRIENQTDLNNLQSSFLADRGNLQRSYNFSNGFCYIAVPEFIDVSGITFIDNDNNLNFSFATQNTWNSQLMEFVSFDNGFTTFNYRIFRGEFFYNSAVSLRIAF